MKKILMILLLLFLSTKMLFADIYNPYICTALEGKSDKEIIFTFYEEGFLISYQITEADVNSKKAFYAFIEMRAIYEYGLGNKYGKNEIKSSELKTILGDLINSAMNPQTAKDYFYKGLFSYSTDPVSSFETPGMYDYFNYVINNFPDTIYAKYSYLLLATNLSYAGHRYNDAINTLNNYITKYGKSDILIANVYFQLFDNYYNLFLAISKSNIQEKNNYGNLMLTYSNKIINEFPEEKFMVEWIQYNLANYYDLIGNMTESQNYDYKVYNNPENSKGLIYGALDSIIKKYDNMKQYPKAYEILEDAKARYFAEKDIRKLYKEKKQYFDEIKYFGYDKYDRSKESLQLYNQKKAQIEAFRAQYEQSWDANFNMIKPLPVPAGQ